MSHTTGGDGPAGRPGRTDDGSPPQPGMGDAPETGEATSAAARLFDLRMIIALLFGIYGVVLTIMGLANTTQAEIDQAGGINLNLWSGLAMLLVAGAFMAWVLLRPLRLPSPEEIRESPTGGHGGH